MELWSAEVSYLMDFELTVLNQGEYQGTIQPVVSTFLQRGTRIWGSWTGSAQVPGLRFQNLSLGPRSLCQGWSWGC